jgi:hypothetical protein
VIVGQKERTLSLKAFLDKTGFSKPLNDMKAEVEQSGKQFAVTSSEVKAFGSETDVLEAKQKYLTDVVAKQKTYVDELAKAHAAAKMEMGADSKAAQTLENQLRSATIRYNNLQGELRNVNSKFDENRKALEAAKAAENQQAKAVDKATLSMKEFMDTAGHTNDIDHLNSTMEQLEREYKLSASAARAYGSKADELKAKQKYLGDALQTQRRFVEKLSDAYEQAKTDTGKDSRATNDLSGELNKARVRYNELNAEIRDTSRDLENETEVKKKSTSGWKDWVKGALAGGITGGTLGAVFSSVGNALGSITGFAKDAFGAVVDGAKNAAGFVRTLAQAFGDLVMQSSASADETLTMAAKMGISAQKVQELQYATELVDVDLDTMASSLAKVTINVGKAADQQADYTKKQKDASKHHKKYTGDLGEQAQAFKDLGVKIKDSKGQLRDTEDVWYEVITVLGKVKNETQQDLLANKLFGKSFAELKPLIDAGGDSLKNLAKEAKKNGYVLSEEQLKKLGDLDDAYQKFLKTADGTRNILAATVAPAFSKFFDVLVQNAPELQEKLTPAMEDLGDALGDAVVDLAPAIPDLIRLGAEAVPIVTDALRTAEPYIAKVLKAAPGILEKIGSALDGMPETAITSLGDFAINSMPALADAAVKCAPSINTILTAVASNSDGLVSAVTAMANSTPEFVDAFAKFVDKAMPALIENTPTIVQGFKDVSSAVLGVAGVISRALDLYLKFAEAYRKFLGMDKEQSTTPSPGNTGTQPNIKGPGMASGGVSTGGVKLVGENGPELRVLPRGTHVFSAPETRAMLGSAGGRREVHHGGTIRVEVVGSDGLMQQAFEYVVDRIDQEVRMS